MKHTRHKDVPLLTHRGNVNHFADEDQEEEEESIKPEIDVQIATHLRQKIYRWLKWFGFRSSPPWIIVFVAFVLLTNLLVNGLTVHNSEYCLYLNICILIFQTESVILYGFAFYSVTKAFIENVVHQLTHIDISSNEYRQIVDRHVDDISADNADDGAAVVSSIKLMHPNMRQEHKVVQQVYNEYRSSSKQTGIQILMKEALKCILIIIPSYLSGYFIFFVAGSSSTEWHVYVYVSNVLDLLRYAPQILHIALARSYFQTFPIQLQRLREELGVVERSQQLSERDYESGALQLSITHSQFVRICEQLIRPYRRMSSRLSEWILVYFVCNIGAFVFFLLSILNDLFGSDCGNARGAGLYYLHYLIELWTFFAGWVFLVLPYCSNQSKLDKFFNDVRTMCNASAIEKCAIDRYIDSFLHRSPFSIYSVTPSYGKFMNLLYLVFATITLDVITKLYPNMDVI